MDAAVWPQIVVKQMEDILPNACIKQPNGGGVENKANRNNNSSRPQKDQIVNCPRCNSTNTKFCYYNNYSLSQPRYFCKSCRRYWTEGGSLRNIPVGGGSRKNNKRSSSLNPSSSSIAPPFKKLHDLSSSSQNPNTLLEGQDLNLAFPAATTTTTPPPPPTTHGFRGMSDFVHLPSNIENNEKSNHHLSALQFLSGVTSRGYNSSFLHMPISDPNAAVYSSSGFSMQEFKPSLNFSLHGLTSNGYPNSVHHQESATGTGSNRPLFPFEDLRQVSNATTNQAEQNMEHGDSSAAGYWNGMSGGGSW